MTKRETTKELLLTVAVAASLAFAIWRTYYLLFYGVDPADSAYQYLLFNHTDAFTVGMIALLTLAVWLDWRHDRGTGSFAALTPFRTFAAIATLALLVWMGFDGT